jgi:hypothetical protein
MIAPPIAADRSTKPATGCGERATIAAQISGRPMEIAIASPGGFGDCDSLAGRLGWR